MQGLPEGIPAVRRGVAKHALFYLIGNSFEFLIFYMKTFLCPLEDEKRRIYRCNLNTVMVNNTIIIETKIRSSQKV